MARMNWDRVRDWDRVRGDLTHAELADERDERWFAREQEREEARRQQPKAPAPKPSTNAVDPSKERRRREAKALENLTRDAKRLGIPKAQLRRQRLAELAKEERREGVVPTRPAPPTSAPPRPPSAKAPIVYLATPTGVVHLDMYCESVQRPTALRADDPSLLGRRVCDRCAHRLPTNAREVERILTSLRVVASTPAPAPAAAPRTRRAPRPTKNAPPSSTYERMKRDAAAMGISLQEFAELQRLGRWPQRLKVAKSAPPRERQPDPKTSKQTQKLERAKAEAKRRGITLEAVLAERREQSQRQKALNLQANPAGD